MTVRLQFVCEDAISSRLIALVGAGEFSHVDALLDDGTLLGARHDSVGSKPAGVNIRPANYARFTKRAIFNLVVPMAHERLFVAFLTKQIGKPYDMAAIWGFVTGRNWRAQDSWICSELQAAALEASGISPPLYLACNKISPVALALTVSALGAKREA